MHNYVPMLIFICVVIPVVYGDCSRATARIVRNVFQQNLEPVFTQHQLAVPAYCPLSAERDAYSLQERLKSSDSPGKWTCGFCGKSFYDEKFLDKHSDLRHADKIGNGEQVTCLADYCDVFRCDVITGRIKPHFWDIALCKETDMNRLFNKCQDLLNECIPQSVAEDQRTSLHEALNKTLCSYLTCEFYWETTDDELPRRRTVFYIIAAVFILFGTFIYYFIAYTHFFTDESLLTGTRPAYNRRNVSAYRNNERVRRRPVNYQGQ